MGLSLIQCRIHEHGYERVYRYVSQHPEILDDWKEIARPEQLCPENMRSVWMMLAGRGFGKTRSGAEWLTEEIRTGRSMRSALVGATVSDVRDTMVEGEAGIMAITRPGEVEYIPSRRKLTWENGAVTLTFSAEEPNRLRGPAHDKAWTDELAAWKYPQETWDQLMFGLRLGPRPQCCVTTTPRPIKLIKDLIKDPTCTVTTGSTYDNKANVSKHFYKTIIQRYEGTRLGRQEIHAEILDDNPDSVFRRIDIDNNRLQKVPSDVALIRCHVGVDPAVTSGENSDDTGIVTVAQDRQSPSHYYVLADDTCHKSPTGWASRAVYSYKVNTADKIVGEVNNGGDLVETIIRSVDPSVNFKSVRASRGKVTRAEPVGALYEQGRVHHIGSFPKLEDEMCNWSPDLPDSPDRMDALVWAISSMVASTTIFVG